VVFVVAGYDRLEGATVGDVALKTDILWVVCVSSVGAACFELECDDLSHARVNNSSAPSIANTTTHLPVYLHLKIKTTKLDGQTQLFA
jgi:hypothetical protein